MVAEFGNFLDGVKQLPGRSERKSAVILEQRQDAFGRCCCGHPVIFEPNIDEGLVTAPTAGLGDLVEAAIILRTATSTAVALFGLRHASGVARFVAPDLRVGEDSKVVKRMAR